MLACILRKFTIAVQTNNVKVVKCNFISLISMTLIEYVLLSYVICIIKRILIGIHLY